MSQMTKEPFADMWNDWFQQANAFVAGPNYAESGAVSDLIRAQFQMLDAIVAHHAGCEERLCPDKQTIRRVIGGLP